MSAAPADDTDLDALIAEAMKNPVVRVEAEEHRISSLFAEAFRAECKRRKISIRKLAKLLNTSVSQAQRILGKEVGAHLSLYTYVRAADLLGLKINVSISVRSGS